ncbi:MAG: TrkA C-terminal domain-containing protein [Candidatus Omnitrophica bacterium]|nr:TrkA C-terminal domain-containing protein [Candidatus Omnitrophota bacterium]
MSIFVFIAVLIVAYFVVKIGAAAFELTGLDPEQSNFQSVSTFTGTGFTTREAELITSHKDRRKIASALMILGNAGFVTLIAALVTTITPGATPKLIIPVEHQLPDFLIPYYNLSLILLLLYLVYRLFHSSRLAEILIDKVQQQMVDKNLIQKARFEELLLNAEGYGISQVQLTDKNPLLGKSLSESKLRANDILVLSIDRGDDHIINPPATTKFTLSDKLVCFGKLDNIRKLTYE